MDNDAPVDGTSKPKNDEFNSTDIPGIWTRTIGTYREGKIRTIEMADAIPHSIDLRWPRSMTSQDEGDLAERRPVRLAGRSSACPRGPPG